MLSFRYAMNSTVIIVVNQNNIPITYQGIEMVFTLIYVMGYRMYLQLYVFPNSCYNCD